MASMERKKIHFWARQYPENDNSTKEESETATGQPVQLGGQQVGRGGKQVGPGGQQVRLGGQDGLNDHAGEVLGRFS